jgi:hypothetical protein
MKEYRGQRFSGERALFKEQDAKITGCWFEGGESHLKESRDLIIDECTFKWKYPIWYSKNIEVTNSIFLDGTRAGIWYTDGIHMKNVTIQSPKNFRRSSDIVLENVQITDAQETLWNCRNIRMKNVTARGDYFAMNSDGLEIDGLVLDGRYCFDGCSNFTIRNSRLLTKDAFWNCRNVRVENSYIEGEYLAWNSSDVVIENCVIDSHQGLCYIEGLKLINCKMMSTSLAFEYSSVDARVDGHIESVLNPREGVIRADHIGELILEKDRIDPGRTKIEAGKIDIESERPDWSKWGL